MQFSEAVRNGMLDAGEAAIGASPILEFRSGVMPANCAAADAGTVLSTMNLPADFMAAAAAGAKAKSGTWEDTLADAGGLVTHFRMKNNAGAVCHIQGLVAMPWAAATPVVVGQHMSNDGGKCYICTTAGTTAGAGGPTGTGAAIADGTAEWDYVGVADMEIVNVNVAVNQPVTVNTFTITAGNA